ncbi:putative carbohydrate esterase family 5 protein [Rosellinia necatrix]|uniref:Putative carbohydrate esterase family 5 protein n=1 Tax=Rosellinia necatrix TaxID=77044 RepID=A0A1W2TAV8_ROSNE|nr:putative carbohydrate esterase family 5 protein [Rosellinia necatrix]
MKAQSVLLSLGLVQAIAGSPVASPSDVDVAERDVDAQACHNVHIFVARGTDEPYPGRQAGLTGAICYGLKNCGYEDIMYQASYSPTYCESVQAGVKNGKAQINAYAKRCPNAKLVLTGYSQGAEVLGDILGGAGGSYFGCSQANSSPLDMQSTAHKNIKAITFFGNVRHVPNQPYNTGTAANVGAGIYPRTGSSLNNLNKYSNKIQDYCLANDTVCGGGGDGSAHTIYFDIYTQTAAEWIKTKL